MKEFVEKLAENMHFSNLNYSEIIEKTMEEMHVKIVQKALKYSIFREEFDRLEDKYMWKILGEFKTEEDTVNKLLSTAILVHDCQENKVKTIRDIMRNPLKDGENKIKIGNMAYKIIKEWA